MKPKQSVYSKMYLVTPNVYDKVLQSLDDKLKKTTAELNVEKETEERPAEKIIENITAQEISPDIEVPEIVNPEFIDPEPQTNEPEQTFGESEAVEPGEITEQTIETEPSEAVVMGPGNQPTINPLTTNCAQPEVQDQFIPLIKKQGDKKVRVSRVTGKITKTLAKPNVIRQIPQIQRLQQQETSFQPNIKRVVVTRPEPMTMIKDIKIKPRKFVCNVCLKGFLSKYHLDRHVNSVHKNLTPQQKSLYEALPDEDIQMDRPVASQLEEEETMGRPVFPKPSTSKAFQSWKAGEEKKSLAPSSKRKTSEAKLKYTPRPTKTRPSDEWFDDWTKTKQ
jgi:hypothetical protein